MAESVRFQNISKQFPGVLALDDVSLSISPGEIHALIGENGAGKSTLVKILGGAYTPSKGQIFLQGAEIRPGSAKNAIDLGIRIVYQELQLIPQLTIAENLLLGHFDTKRGLIDTKTMESRVQAILDEYQLPLRAERLVEHLSIGEKQLVEIAKCCVGNPAVIALDEPTSSLSSKEIEILFTLIKKLQAQGRTILYISHRFNEIFQICTSATVLRDGKLIKTYLSLDGISPTDLINQMVGRKLEAHSSSYRSRPVGARRLEVQSLRSPLLDCPMNFHLNKNEILGFFGLVGAGRTELMRSLIGAAPKISGQILLDGKKISITHPKDGVKYGLAYLTEDRKKDGIIHETDITDNTMINSRVHFSLMKFFLRRKVEERVTHLHVEALKTKVSALSDKITQLSGGNQQKVIIGRWLSNPNIDILILDEPTRGIDVGAKQEIYKLIQELAEKNYSIIIVSSELPEIISLCDRAYVLHQKNSITEVLRDEINEKNLLNLAFFGSKE